MSSEEESESATLKAGNETIKFCPFCGVEFSQYLICNKKNSCPVEGGCGKSFAIYEK